MNKILRKVLCGALLCFTSGVAFAAESDVMACDFSNGATMEGWTVADMNGDGVTWAEQEGLKGAVYNGCSTLNPAEDWLFTPAFATEAGNFATDLQKAADLVNEVGTNLVNTANNYDSCQEEVQGSINSMLG